MQFGVSPAWYLSMCGEDFTCKDIAENLPIIRDQGFTGWQPEVFVQEQLLEWESGKADILKTRSVELGMRATQFVAHFLLHAFADADSIQGDWGIDECRRLLTVLNEWPEIEVVTVPVPAFGGTDYVSSDAYASIHSRFVEKLDSLAEIIEAGGKICGLEILPGSILGGSEGAARLRDRKNSPNYHINLDTGHFFAGGELLRLTLGKMGENVSGTHLCDNDGVVNLSLEPGAGGVDWMVFRDWYSQSGYNGFLDIEIRCPKGEVDQRYRKGLAFLKALLQND